MTQNKTSPKSLSGGKQSGSTHDRDLWILFIIMVRSCVLDKRKLKRNHRFLQTCSHEDRDKGMKQKPANVSLTHRLFDVIMSIRKPVVFFPNQFKEKQKYTII